jgi:GTP-dependent phosphoenolpyruvate carboxykinase
MKELMRVDLAAWSAEVPDIERHFEKFVARLPERLTRQLQGLRSRLG